VRRVIREDDWNAPWGRERGHHNHNCWHAVNGGVEGIEEKGRWRRESKGDGWGGGSDGAEGMRGINLSLRGSLLRYVEFRRLVFVLVIGSLGGNRLGWGGGGVGEVGRDSRGWPPYPVIAPRPGVIPGGVP